MATILARFRWWIALAGALLLIGTFAPRGAGAQSELDEAELERAELASVQIYILDPDGEPFGTCSGTFQTPDGIILTNFHCVGYTDLYGGDDSGLDLEHGDLYNPDGLVVIAPTKNDREVPKPTYVARVLSANPALDIAVVKIIGMLKEGQKLPSRLPIVTIKRADSDTVKTSDFVGVIGYPGVGGPTLTYTSGQIAGFEDQDGDEIIDSFKTTAPINPGNSGGLAVNAEGEQIGIPTYGVSEGASKIDRIKMVNVAIPYIEDAIKGGSGVVDLDPVPDPIPDEGVTLQGKIVDANTKRGVAGALLIVLQPGVTADEFEESGFDEDLVATLGTTDRSGNYQTSPMLPRGQTYTVIVGARGYNARVFRNALTIDEDEPDVAKVDPISIEKN